MQNLATLKTELLYNQSFLTAVRNVTSQKWDVKFAYSLGRLGKVLEKQRSETDDIWSKKQDGLEWIEEKDEEGKLLSKKPKDEAAYKAIEKELLGAEFALEDRWLINCAHLLGRDISAADLLSLEPLLTNTELLTA